MALDLSAQPGRDLKSSAVILGRALNDPIRGLTALRRVGVSFIEVQQEQIRTMVEAGNIGGAQALMPELLEAQYGQAAETLAQTGSGKIGQMWNAIGDAM